MGGGVVFGVDSTGAAGAGVVGTPGGGVVGVLGSDVGTSFVGVDDVGDPVGGGSEGVAGGVSAAPSAGAPWA